MPIYEYTCQECDKEFEKFVRSMTAQPEIKCPQCGSVHVKKGWSAFATSGPGGGGAAAAAAAAAACSPGGT
ncbi:MAG: zinc ribbon domain-containing protein [Anaerolineae bacterium]|nr:zinc ribbon domain-containing protein [Anaerolineae bacterium]